MIEELMIIKNKPDALNTIAMVPRDKESRKAYKLYEKCISMKQETKKAKNEYVSMPDNKQKAIGKLINKEDG